MAPNVYFRPSAPLATAQLLVVLLALPFPFVTITNASSPLFSLVSSLDSLIRSRLVDRITALSGPSASHLQGVASRRRLAGITQLVERVEPQLSQQSPLPLGVGNAVGRAALYVDDGMMAVGGAAGNAVENAAIDPAAGDGILLSGASAEGDSPLEGNSLLPLDAELVTDVSPAAKQQVLQRQQQQASHRSGNPEERTSCSMDRGSWQVDGTWPLYDATCPFIYPNQNCVKNGRPDRFFERLRWTTPGCPLPTLNRDTLCSLVAGKNIAFVGDSMTRNTFESLACLMYGFYGMPEKLGGFSMANGFERGAVWAACNFTLAFYRTNFLVDMTLDDPHKPNGGGVMDLNKPELIWRRRLQQHDIFVINTGRWWNENKLQGLGFRFAPPHQGLSVVEGFEKAWEMTLGVFKSERMQGKVLVVSTNAAAHFTGEGFTGECPDTVPMSASGFLNYKGKGNCLKMDGLNGVMRRLVVRMHGQERAEGRVGGARVMLLDQARPAMVRSDGHPGKWALLPSGKQDCGHYCLPGVPDSWNEMMLQRLWLLREGQRE
ncbi:hypothetical protein CLOP_g22884 [Closterium sp. NIES-67]|nr:hypothetical protein CLOP_g22884 [Closterium sp. NIES-67]